MLCWDTDIDPITLIQIHVSLCNIKYTEGFNCHKYALQPWSIPFKSTCKKCCLTSTMLAVNNFHVDFLLRMCTIMKRQNQSLQYLEQGWIVFTDLSAASLLDFKIFLEDSKISLLICLTYVKDIYWSESILQACIHLWCFCINGICYMFYYTHFEITGGPCNLIGSNWCDLFTNRTIFCFKSHLFPR